MMGKRGRRKGWKKTREGGEDDKGAFRGSKSKERRRVRREGGREGGRRLVEADRGEKGGEEVCFRG